MSDLYNRIVGERNSLEKLLEKIPGFGGYMEMSGRREADRMIRDHVAAQYQNLIDRFAGLERDILGVEGGLGHMEKTKSIKTKIEVMRRRIATDMPGYSGFFAANKIGPEELQKVYSFDESMLTYVESIGGKLDDLRAAITGGTIPAALDALNAALEEASQAYDLRDNLLKGLE
jgi:hypothetical protein